MGKQKSEKYSSLEKMQMQSIKQKQIYSSKMPRNKRGYGKKSKSKNKVNNFKILGNNPNGISSKRKSFQNLLNLEKPSVFTLQETKLRNSGKFRIKGYTIFEGNRKSNNGGGIMIGVNNEIKSDPIW